jgi:hypothetical protein
MICHLYVTYISLTEFQLSIIVGIILKIKMNIVHREFSGAAAAADDEDQYLASGQGKGA